MRDKVARVIREEGDPKNSSVVAGSRQSFRGGFLFVVDVPQQELVTVTPRARAPSHTGVSLPSRMKRGTAPKTTHSLDVDTIWFLLHHDHAMLKYRPVLSRAPRRPAGRRIMQWNLPDRVETNRNGEFKRITQRRKATSEPCPGENQGGVQECENQFARSICGWSGRVRMMPAAE